MSLLVGCGGDTQQVIVKEVIVEKIVVVTATPTPTPTQVPPTATQTATAIPTAPPDPMTIFDVRITESSLPKNTGKSECFGVYVTNTSGRPVFIHGPPITIIGYTDRDIEVYRWSDFRTEFHTGVKLYGEYCFESSRITRLALEYNTHIADWKWWRFIGSGLPELDGTPWPLPSSSEFSKHMGPLIFKDGKLRLDLAGGLGNYLETVLEPDAVNEFDETGAHIVVPWYWEFDNVSDIDLTITYCSAVYYFPPIEPDAKYGSVSCGYSHAEAKKSGAMRILAGEEPDPYGRSLPMQKRLLGLWIITRKKSPW